MMVPDESGRSPCRVDVHPWDRARALLPQAAQVSRAISFIGCPWTATVGPSSLTRHQRGRVWMLPALRFASCCALDWRALAGAAEAKVTAP